MRAWDLRAQGPVQQAVPSDPHLWQIHWAASPQRIEECVLSGKNGNVSVVGFMVGSRVNEPRQGMEPGRCLHLFSFLSGLRASVEISSGSSSPGTEHTCMCAGQEPTTLCAPM